MTGGLSAVDPAPTSAFVSPLPELVLAADDDAPARTALEALAPGDALILAGEDPRALLDELDEESPGRFEWSILEDSAERSRLEVRRRAAEGPRTVTGFLQGDHRRLDAIVPDVERLVDDAAFPAAARRFAEFMVGLDWHIDVEEQVLFPYFEVKTGMTGGPTNVMRSEHVEIRARMKRVTNALEAGDATGARDALSELTTFLATHNMKEERMLYPMTDRAIETVEAQERFVRRIARFG